MNDYTYPTYLDVSLPADTVFQQTLPPQHNAFVYVIAGSMSVLDDVANPADVQTNVLSAKHLGVLTKGGQLSVRSGDSGARLLLIAGQPLNEPVARGGPFVMNTNAEVLQAFTDFNSGKF